ncbi:hypothetical protein LTR47_012121, partial [Exophiala xenobiotica]
ASLVLGLISSIIAIYEGAHEIYEAAGDVKGLPRKVQLVAEQIPLVPTRSALRNRISEPKL